MVASSKNDGSSILLSLLLVGVVVSALMAGVVESFSPSLSSRTSIRTTSPVLVPPSTVQHGRCAAASGMDSTSALFAAGKKKRRRRKRKNTPPGTTEAEAPAQPKAAAAPVSVDASPVSMKSESVVERPVAPPVDTTPPAIVDAPPAPASVVESESVAFEGEEINVDDIKGVADFSFKGPGGIESSPQAVDDSAAAPTFSSVVQEEDGSIPLPDIRDTLRRKQMGDVSVKGPMEDNMPKEKIDRTDRDALLKLLERDPYADGDDSFFFEQEYTSISAWLGEGTKPFLGIPTGPLQVGHTIGALVIVLMAYIEYPGFPLTNLPTPLRGALQGGLGTIYGINILLCVLTFFKAQERGQPVPLWIAKTFTVGGLALDQLSQLPTLEQVEKAKARKGKRALRNRK